MRVLGHVEEKRGNSEIGEVFEGPGDKIQAMLKKKMKFILEAMGSY